MILFNEGPKSRVMDLFQRRYASSLVVSYSITFCGEYVIFAMGIHNYKLLKIFNVSNNMQRIQQDKRQHYFRTKKVSTFQTVNNTKTQQEKREQSSTQ